MYFRHGVPDRFDEWLIFVAPRNKSIDEFGLHASIHARHSPPNRTHMPLIGHAEIRALMFSAVYGAVVATNDDQPTNRHCEDCGGVVVAGLEPITAADDPELTARGVSAVGSEWCTNVDCPSNHAVPGLWRVGVNDYTCKMCGEALRTPMSEVVAHRRTH